MTTTPTKYLIAATVGAALAALALPVAAQDKPTFEVAPYLWLANPSIETGVPQVGSAASSGVQKFDTSFSAGLMLAAEARYHSVGLLADFNWLQVNTDAANPGPFSSTVNLKSDLIYSTVGLSYALPLKGKFHAEAVAGARIWYVGMDFTVAGLDSSISQTWVDPMVGANLSYDLTRHWLLIVRGKVGGFTDSDLGWEVFGGVGYQFNDWLMAVVGYRYLYQQYDHNDFTFNLDVQGALVGVVFKF